MSRVCRVAASPKVPAEGFQIKISRPLMCRQRDAFGKAGGYGMTMTAVVAALALREPEPQDDHADDGGDKNQGE